MNKRELKKFEKLLLAERERLGAGVKSLEREHLYQPIGEVHGLDSTNFAEVGTDSFARETALAVAGTESERLFEIKEALKRIREGTYGICEGTGKPIPKKRLEVFPAARYCVEHQEALENSAGA